MIAIAWPSPRGARTAIWTGGSAHNGKVKITYTNGTGKLKILPAGGNLHVYNVSGCGGLIASHDAGTISGTYTVNPAQKITSP